MDQFYLDFPPDDYDADATSDGEMNNTSVAIRKFTKIQWQWQSILIAEDRLTLSVRIAAGVLLAFYLVFVGRILQNFRRLDNHFYAFLLSFALAGWGQLALIIGDFVLVTKQACVVNFYTCLYPILIVDNTCWYACLMTSFLLAINRYLVVTNYPLYLKVFTWRSIIVSLLVIWISACLEASSIIFATPHFNGEFDAKFVNDGWLYICDIVVPYLLLFASFILYLLIYARVRKQKRRLTEHNLGTRLRPLNERGNEEVAEDDQNNSSSEQQRSRNGSASTALLRVSAVSSRLFRNAGAAVRRREISILVQAFITTLMICFYRVVTGVYSFIHPSIYKDPTMRVPFNALSFYSRLAFYGLQPFVLLVFSSELRALFFNWNCRRHQQAVANF